MVEFLAGIFVSLFLIASAGVGYYMGLTQKTKPTISSEAKQETEDEKNERLYQERYKKDFQVMMNYNNHLAYQPKRELGE